MLSWQEMISLQRLKRRKLNGYFLVKLRGLILLPVEITQAVRYLSKKYPMATVLLYGSYAVNLHTANSDIDLIVFTNISKAIHETTEFNLHPVSYTHLTLTTKDVMCRSRCSPDH